ncbi:MAG: hypothetical protein N3D15_07235 [Syntrophorhabdaceae bacterium]|nr:hypothetical protein [Syntrophorhabdaceae bacterium]
MSSLIDDVLSVEKQADSIIEGARKEARQIEKNCEEEIEAYRRHKTIELDNMIVDFQKKAEEEYISTLSRYENELKESINQIEGISEQVISQQIEQILERLYRI